MNKSILITLAIAIPISASILILGILSPVGTTETPAPSVAMTDSDQIIFVPEGYRRLEDYTIVIDVAILPGLLEAFWVIYGTEAENLEFKTPPVSNELGMGTAGEYGWYSLAIPHEELQPGISYFYRVVGETTEDEILFSGLNRFTAGK